MRNPESTILFVGSLLALTVMNTHALVSYQKAIHTPGPEPIAIKPFAVPGPEPIAIKPFAVPGPEPIAIKPFPVPGPEPIPFQKLEDKKDIPDKAPNSEPSPSQQYKGSVLVLVLYTSSLKTERVALVSQLKHLQKRNANSLIGGQVWRFHVKGCEPWDDRAIPTDYLFPNNNYHEMFQRVFDDISALKKKVENKKFRTILIWESDLDPDVGQAIRVPTEGDLNLCYWFPNLDRPSPKLEMWFHNKAGYLDRVEKLADFLQTIVN